MEQYFHQLTDFVRLHQAWAAPIVFGLAFGESLAFVSLFLPATVALVGIGAMIGASGISFAPIFMAAAVGAALGDWVSYWVGRKFHTSIPRLWPFSTRPDLLPKGEEFVKKWGVPSIFIGRFFGPARAVVPLVAGMFEMPFWWFQLANWSSAFLWAAVLLAPGTLGLKAFF